MSRGDWRGAGRVELNEAAKDEDGEVIDESAGLPTAGEIDDGGTHGAGIGTGGGREAFGEALGAEHAALCIGGLGDTVGEEDEGAAGLEHDGLDADAAGFAFIEDAEHGGGGVGELADALGWSWSVAGCWA